MDSGKINSGRNPVWDELLASGRGRPAAPAAPAEGEIPVVLPKSGIVVTLSGLSAAEPELPDLPIAASPRTDRPATPNPAETPVRDAQLLARALASGAYAAPLTQPRQPSAPTSPAPPRTPALPREPGPVLARTTAAALASATARANGLASVLAQALAPELAPAPGRPPAPGPGLPLALAPGLATSPATAPAFAPVPGYASAPAAASPPAAAPAPAPAPFAQRTERSADEAFPPFAAVPARSETSAPGSPVAPLQPGAPAESAARMDVPVPGQVPPFSPASPGVTRNTVTPEDLHNHAVTTPRASPEVMTHLIPRPTELSGAVPYLNRLIVGAVVLGVVLLLVL